MRIATLSMSVLVVAGTISACGCGGRTHAMSLPELLQERDRLWSDIIEKSLAISHWYGCQAMAAEMLRHDGGTALDAMGKLTHPPSSVLRAHRECVLALLGGAKQSERSRRALAEWHRYQREAAEILASHTGTGETIPGEQPAPVAILDYQQKCMESLRPVIEDLERQYAGIKAEIDRRQGQPQGRSGDGRHE